MQLKLLEVNKMNNVLEAKHINKYFKKPVLFHVLNDINLEVKIGEFVSIMGKSGCGKSTLLYILSTMDTEYEGELLLNNQLITGRSRHQLSYIRNKHIGFVFQFHYLLSEFSVLENIMLPAKKLAEKSLEEIEHDARQKLKMLNIEHLSKKRASRISGGEKQRVAIARALINNPTIIMGDEPTGNLDSYNSENVFNIFKQLSDEQGLSLLIVTHDKDLANKTNRIIEMEDGKIIQQYRNTK
jgi:lipoprotein-releasing system ATP-binding protein